MERLHDSCEGRLHDSASLTYMGETSQSLDIKKPPSLLPPPPTHLPPSLHDYSWNLSLTKVVSLCYRPVRPSFRRWALGLDFLKFADDSPGRVPDDPRPPALRLTTSTGRPISTCTLFNWPYLSSEACAFVKGLRLKNTAPSLLLLSEISAERENSGAGMLNHRALLGLDRPREEVGARVGSGSPQGLTGGIITTEVVFGEKRVLELDVESEAREIWTESYCPFLIGEGFALRELRLQRLEKSCGAGPDYAEGGFFELTMNCEEEDGLDARDVLRVVSAQARPIM